MKRQTQLRLTNLKSDEKAFSFVQRWFFLRFVSRQLNDVEYVIDGIIFYKKTSYNLESYRRTNFRLELCCGSNKNCSYCGSMAKDCF